MPQLRVAFLWHMHQPYYKDLATGDYRLPWVRSHALKDYYGMVKLLEEFPGVHQTFNLVPSLMVQIQDYASGSAKDPFLRVAAKPAAELTLEERRFALAYLFQANPAQMIGRYPRYLELWTKFTGAGGQAARAEPYFQRQDYTDLQVLSQIAWFDEFFLEEPEIAQLVSKARNFTLEDQAFVIRKERELCGRVLPAYADAAREGRIEISTSPFYHPILPLLCDTNQGAVSSPNLPLPARRFRRPEDARKQMESGLELHQQVFGVRPVGVWPSEGSVSEEVLAIAADLGVEWMATDEGVLGRTLGTHFTRSADGRLSSAHAEALYSPYVYEKGGARMSLIFRDHSLSDLIGFVYSGVPAKDAAEHFVRNLKESAKAVVAKGKDAFLPVILDGENAWEFYPQSGREFLRRVYDALQRDPAIEALSVHEALARHSAAPKLAPLVPGSWINANFNVWIGAPEDNRAWDYLNDARDFYERAQGGAEPEQRELAFEELLIAEGSDWNWWYGPEHHSANDRDFDELYRKHLTNVYQALGVEAPDYLAQPIAAGVSRPAWAPQTAYIRPKIGSGGLRYFDWIGAAMYTSDQHSGAMHGKTFLLDCAHAGIDEHNLYGRLDFAGGIPREPVQLSVNFEIFHPPAEAGPQGAVTAQSAGAPMSADTSRVRLIANLEKKLLGWELRAGKKDEVVLASNGEPGRVQVVLPRNFEFQVPLEKLGAAKGSSIRLRFSLWRDGMPVDAVPLEGSITLQVVEEEELERNIFGATR